MFVTTQGVITSFAFSFTSSKSYVNKVWPTSTLSPAETLTSNHSPFIDTVSNPT